MVHINRLEHNIKNLIVKHTYFTLEPLSVNLNEITILTSQDSARPLNQYINHGINSSDKRILKHSKACKWKYRPYGEPATG